MNQLGRRPVELVRRTLLWVLCGMGTALGAPAQDPDAVLTLDRVVELYVEGSFEAEAARLEVERVRAGRITADLRPNPDLTITAENFRLAGDPSFGELYEMGVSYSETIELGGKRGLRNSVADLDVAVAEARLEDTLRRGIVRVKRLYYEAVLARERVLAASANRDAFGQLEGVSQLRFDEGAIAEADLIKVRLEGLQFDRALQQAELGRDQALIRLLERLGETEYRDRTVAGDLQFTGMPYDLELLKSMALEERPDVRAAELEVTLARDRLALERANGSSDISPFVGYKRVASSDTLLFGVSIPLPFHDRNEGGIAQAVTGESVAGTRLGAVRNRTLAEVEAAYRAWELARDQIGVFQDELLAQADASYEIASVAYTEGAVDLLALFEAQRTQTLVRNQFLQTLFDYQTSVLDLELAVGRDLQ